MYLIGGVVHLFLGLAHPEVYAGLGRIALIEPYRWLFSSLSPGSATAFASIISAFELALALLLFNDRYYARIGLIVSILFQILLVPLGIWGVINVLLAVTQSPLLVEPPVRMRMFSRSRNPR